MKKSCGYEIADETIDASTARRSEEEKDRRLDAEKDRRRAEEMDRITKKCMKSGIEALQELERAKWSIPTRGFKSYALVDNRVQEAVRKNDKDTEKRVRGIEGGRDTIDLIVLDEKVNYPTITEAYILQ